jgi:hypothetical protein
MTSKQKVIQLKKRLQQNKSASSFFVMKEALRLEGSPESRKASKALNVQYHGPRYTSPQGFYFPNKSISAR